MASANSSLAYKTWAGTKTVTRLIEKCEHETGVSLALPWSSGAMATFIGWNIQKQKMESTIKIYISKVRVRCHIKSHTITFLGEETPHHAGPQLAGRSLHPLPGCGNWKAEDPAQGEHILNSNQVIRT